MAALEVKKREYSKVLIVEGGEDKHFVISLMKNYVDWPEIPATQPLYVDDRKGIDQILKRESLTTELKGSIVRTLGVIVDADDNPQSRYNQIRNLVMEVLPDMPKDPPSSGLIMDSPENVRFGLWIMPNNTGPGALEDFIEQMVPSEQDRLWAMASECVTNAQNLGAKVRDTHVAKSRLYTWLAWQDPPGYSPGNAVTRRMLNFRSPSCQEFVKWFNNLFELTPRIS